MPLIAASVRTLVVSWKDAADRKELVARDALVIPSSTCLPSAGCWCYQRGAFTAPEATVEDMIAFDLKFNEENGHPFGPQEEAERLLRAWLPTLKRWRK